MVFNKPLNKIPGDGKGIQRNEQRNIPKSWRKYCCLSPQMGPNTALLRNTWITWNLPGMAAALCGLCGAGAEPGHSLWTLHLTGGSHVHLGSGRNNHGYKPWGSFISHRSLAVTGTSCGRAPRRSHLAQQLKLSPSQNSTSQISVQHLQGYIFRSRTSACGS